MFRLGIDLCEVPRIEKAMARSERFCRRVLGAAEYEMLARRGFPPQSVAASFAAKEAFSKAMGTGVRGFSLRDVELLRAENGAPVLRLSGRAAALAKGLAFSVSVTHTKALAAVVVAAQAEDH